MTNRVLNEFAFNKTPEPALSLLFAAALRDSPLRPG